MNFFTPLLTAFYSFVAFAGLFLLSFANALDDSPATTTDSPSYFSNPLATFNKLKESLSAVNWNEYFEDILHLVSRNNTNISQEMPINASDNVYLDPNGPSVQFILFTNQTWRHNFKVNSHEDFLSSGFDNNNPTKIIIHGFLSSSKYSVFQLNKDAYLESGNYNVIAMDWSVLCEFEYFTAMRGAQIAGSELGLFINWLVKENVSLNDIHVIGHSLGAHVAAMGAAKVRDGTLSRITGLDPAGPGYNEVPAVYRLDPTDARIVDVIHTNMRVLSSPQPQGHLDFYPNGGRFQPGCPNMYDIWTIGDSVECNHGRAYHYFAESITNKKAFKSIRCPTVEAANLNTCTMESDVYMGQVETYQPGLYYFKTRDTSPFSLT